MKTIEETNNLVSEVQITYLNKISASDRLKVTKIDDCIRIFRSVSRYNANISLYECFYAMYLNRNNKVLSVMLISEGGTCGTVVDVKKILSPAILQNSSAIILSHNHPSGNTQPSEADINTTKKVVQAALLMDIKVIDHVILTEESFYSFADEGLI